MGQKLALLNDQYNIYYQKALKAKENSDFKNAKLNFLLAAQTLLEMCKESPAPLKEVRLKNAKTLLEMASKLDNKISKEEKSNHSNNNQQDETETKWDKQNIPDISFDDVAGLDEVKESVKMRVILPIKNKEVFSKYNKKVGGGILLYGLPGTGKTMIAKAIAHEINASFYEVKCSDIVSKWVGESERNIKNLFVEARKNKVAVIFFDEFEAIAAKRGSNSTVMNRIVPELLAQIQGFNDNDCMLLLLAATNRPWDIDSAMLRPGRFNELIYVPLPDYESRLKILQLELNNIPMDASIDLSIVSKKLEGFNGSDIVEFCDRLKEGPIIRTLNSEINQYVTNNDIDKTLEKVKSSVSKEDIKNLDKFRNIN